MRKQGSDIPFLMIVCVLALALRLDFLIASNFVLDSDEAIVGLMAKHITEGREIPTFFYGQSYMGSFEALVAAGLFQIFGISGAWLKAVPLIFSIYLIPLTYWLGRSLANRYTGRVAAILIAIPPSPLVIWSSMARGGFIEIVCLSTLALALAVAWLKRPNVLLTIGIGLVLGFGWWINNQIIYAILPIGFCMLVRIWTQGDYPIGPLVIHAGSGLIAFAIGGAPFWIFNLTHDWKSFGIFNAAAGGSIWSHIAGLFTTSLPMLLGGKLFWHEEDLFPFSTLIVLTAYGACFLLVLGIRAKEIGNLFRFRIAKEQPLEILFLFLLTAFAAFALSSFGHLVSAPRYLLPIYPVIFILVGVVLSRLAELQRSFATAAVVLLLALHLYSSYPGKRAIPGQPFVAEGQRASLSHEELIAWLHEQGTSVVETNYWVGYRLAFETSERVVFGIFREPHEARMPEYEQRFKEAPLREVPMILVPAQAEKVRSALQTAGMDWKEAILADYVVVYDRDRKAKDLVRVSADGLSVATSSKEDVAPMVIDGDVSTRWGSGMPQRPGMEVSVTLEHPEVLRNFRYDIGQWKSDLPRGLNVEVESADGSRTVILTEDQARAQEFYAELDPVLDIVLPNTPIKKIVLHQTGSDPIFDWSIAELELYR